jgi:6-phosphofructokinase 2
MTPILTITLNPTVDLALETGQVRPDRKLRCTRPEARPGGGGLNVSRAILELGGQSTAFVAVGETTGDKVMRLLAEAGIGIVPFPAPGETRQSFSVIERDTGAEFRFVMPGPDWGARDLRRVLTRIARAAPENGIVVLSGSQPPGVPEDFPALLAARIARTRAQLVIDTSGRALARLAAAPIRPADVLRMDGEEAEELAGRALPTAADSADFAQELVCAGVAAQVIVARGGAGNVLAGATQRWLATPPEVAVVSKVGAGDSFTGAFTLALARGQDSAEALRFGTAAAAAAVMTPATGLCRARDLRALLPGCRLGAI